MSGALITIVFLFVLLGALLVVIASTVISRLRSGAGEEVATKEKPLYQYRNKKYFLTQAEHDFYKKLLVAADDKYFVFAQVHLPTIVNHEVPGQNWRAAFRHINGKSVDFVLCDKIYISPKLAIELDDSSHKRPDRQERDKEVERILEEADVPLLRLENGGSLTTEEIAEKIQSI